MPIAVTSSLHDI